jgi:hypothetical protein
MLARAGRWGFNTFGYRVYGGFDEFGIVLQRRKAQIAPPAAQPVAAIGTFLPFIGMILLLL